METDPPLGSVLGHQSPITFYFNQPVNKPSAQSAFTGLPAGTFTWNDDATLVFSPTQPYQPNTPLRFSIANSLQSANGFGMAEPVGSPSRWQIICAQTFCRSPARGCERRRGDCGFLQPAGRHWGATLPRSLLRSRSSRLWKGARNGSTPAPTSFILNRRWQGNRISRQPEYGIENGFGCRMSRSRTAGMDVHNLPSQRGQP